MILNIPEVTGNRKSIKTSDTIPHQTNSSIQQISQVYPAEIQAVQLRMPRACASIDIGSMFCSLSDISCFHLPYPHSPYAISFALRMELAQLRSCQIAVLFLDRPLLPRISFNPPGDLRVESASLCFVKTALQRRPHDNIAFPAGTHPYRQDDGPKACTS